MFVKREHLLKLNTSFFVSSTVEPVIRLPDYQDLVSYNEVNILAFLRAMVKWLNSFTGCPINKSKFAASPHLAGAHLQESIRLYLKIIRWVAIHGEKLAQLCSWNAKCFGYSEFYILRCSLCPIETPKRRLQFIIPTSRQVDMKSLVLMWSISIFVQFQTGRSTTSHYWTFGLTKAIQIYFSGLQNV